MPIVERTVTQLIVNERTCLHGVKDSKKKFFCVPMDDHYVLECPENCGYYLNFSPDFAGRFKGEPGRPLVTSEYGTEEYLWRVRTVHYAPLHKMVDQPTVQGNVTPHYGVKTTAVSIHKMQQGE